MLSSCSFSFFFFFKQKTAYEMRISDWSSDVCSSDLTSRRIATTPYEILRFIGRGTSLRDYQRLRAAFDRLQSTSVATSIREPTGRRLHRFSWLNEWKERTDRNVRPRGVELILPDWFYPRVFEHAPVLTITPTYSLLTARIPPRLPPLDPK